MEKLEALQNALQEMLEDGICLAVSGGVDSNFLMALLSKMSMDFPSRLFCASFITGLQGDEEKRRIEALKEKYPESLHEILFLDLLSNPVFAENPVDRCYQCKKSMFSSLRKQADSRNFKWLLDGTQADDLKTYRPGLKALKEFQVRSPLLECGIGKNEVRHYAKKLGFSFADLPPGTCLATRIPHGTRLDPEILSFLDMGEKFLRSLGFLNVRIRLHGDLCRIEVPKEDFPVFMQQREMILKGLDFLPCRYLTLDMEGLYSGSMDPISNA